MIHQTLSYTLGYHAKEACFTVRGNSDHVGILPFCKMADAPFLIHGIVDVDGAGSTARTVLEESLHFCFTRSCFLKVVHGIDIKLQSKFD